MGTLTARLFGVTAAIAMMLTCAGCIVGERNTNGDSDMSELTARIDDVGYSRLDDAGIEQIKDSRIAKFDLRTGTETLAAVGLPSGPHVTGPAIGGADEPDLLLVLDGPQGREVTDTRTIMVAVSPRYNTLYEMVYWRSADDIEHAIEEVRSGITRWGYSKDRVDTWIDGVNKHRNDSYKRVVSTGVSPTGLVTSVEVSYKAGKPVVLRYILHLLPSMYAPENLEAIRRTGMTAPDYVGIP